MLNFVSLRTMYAENPKNIRLLLFLQNISAFTRRNYFEKASQKERELGTSLLLTTMNISLDFLFRFDGF